MESMESHKAGFPPFAHSVEIPSGLPHSHGLDYETKYSEATAKTSPKPDLSPYRRKGVVTDVPGPKCNERSGTLICRTPGAHWSAPFFGVFMKTPILGRG